jgi:GT2 family glycosyltransferase
MQLSVETPPGSMSVVPSEEGVTASILSFNRPRTLDHVLSVLHELPLEEVIVVDTSHGDDCLQVGRTHGARVIALDDIGVAARNVSVREARTELVMLLDDDSYPLPGTTERLRAAFEERPRLGVVGGYVHQPLAEGESDGMVHAFDWFLDGRDAGMRSGAPAVFFPEGACMVRRSAFLEVGGFFAPGFLTVTELDLATRLIGCGWDVRYVRDARFHHLVSQEGRTPSPRSHRYKVRNEIWYFWLRFPRGLAVRRILAYLAFDLIEALYRGFPGAWLGGVADAWRQRDSIAGHRAPLPRAALRRAEMDRGRRHLRLLALVARVWLRRRLRGKNLRMAATERYGR